MASVRILVTLLLLAVVVVSADFDCKKCKYSGGKCVSKSSYTCECKKGYGLWGNKCTDYCNGICHKNEKCVNVYGKYKCKCKDGYRRYGKKCKPYCKKDCHKYATCKRSRFFFLWRYKCECDDGYYGNGYYCTDHCYGRCHKDAKCVRHYGQYRCQCKSGYSGDGYDCKTPCGYCPKHAKCVEKKEKQCKCGYGYKQHGKYCRRPRQRYPW
ncbi:uncharacterized protein LOC143465195 [Clavelina lepadiformis]|uniref:uncharacterized protein LOC143465195 n=1 Tax=Clavelina lepadiformis TaxID=159417 RepID=UPI00404258B7